MTDNQAQALQVEPDAGGDIGRCIGDRRPQTASPESGPTKSLRCSPGIAATRTQRRVSPHPPPARLGALAFGAPACGAFAPGRRRPQAGLPVALRSAPQSGQAVHATAAPTRRRRRRARREEAPVTPPAQSRGLVTPVACTAWSLAGGAMPHKR